MTTNQVTTLRALGDLLLVASSNGLLDQLSSYCHPDTVNQFCDGVKDMVAAETAPNHPAIR